MPIWKCKRVLLREYIIEAETQEEAQEKFKNEDWLWYKTLDPNYKELLEPLEGPFEE